MDTFGASGITLLFIACCETIAVAWIYGNSNLVSISHRMCYRGKNSC